jgi:hypothetical protein
MPPNRAPASALHLPPVPPPSLPNSQNKKNRKQKMEQKMEQKGKTQNLPFDVKLPKIGGSRSIVHHRFIVKNLTPRFRRRLFVLRRVRVRLWFLIELFDVCFFV